MDAFSFSIVTPSLNAAATIEQTLASVREQGAPRVEHIVVDGGSTDGTQSLLDRAPGVRWISEPDEGLSDAVNKGIRMATGDFVGWLNADDVYRPGALRSVADELARRPEARWAFGRCAIIDGDGREMRKGVTAYKDFFCRRWSFPLHLTHNFVSAPATFMRRDALDEVGLFDKRFKYSMDYDVWLRLGRRWPPVFVDRELAAFRMVEGTLSMTGFERQFVEHAQCAQAYRRDHPFAVTANRALSQMIVFAYRGMRLARGRGS